MTKLWLDTNRTLSSVQHELDDLEWERDIRIEIENIKQTYEIDKEREVTDELDWVVQEVLIEWELLSIKDDKVLITDKFLKLMPKFR